MSIFQQYSRITRCLLLAAGLGAFVLFYLLNLLAWYTLDPATSPLKPEWIRWQAWLSGFVWFFSVFVIGRWVLFNKRPPIHIFWPYHITFVLWGTQLFVEIIHIANLFSNTLRDFWTPLGPIIMYLYALIAGLCAFMLVISYIWYQNFPKPKPFVAKKNKSSKKAKKNTQPGKFRQLLHRFLILDILTGLYHTGKNIFKPSKTIQFPDESLPTSPRFRGVLALRRYPNGEERCIACKLCEAVCPALAITIEAEPREDGSRRTKRFDVDMFKCINCGFCEEACPVDSIVVTPEHHYVIRERGENILTKEKLLAIGDRCEQQIALDRIEDEPYR